MRFRSIRYVLGAFSQGTALLVWSAGCGGSDEARGSFGSAVGAPEGTVAYVLSGTDAERFRRRIDFLLSRRLTQVKAEADWEGFRAGLLDDVLGEADALSTAEEVKTDADGGFVLPSEGEVGLVVATIGEGAAKRGWVVDFDKEEKTSGLILDAGNEASVGSDGAFPPENRCRRLFEARLKEIELVAEWAPKLEPLGLVYCPPGSFVMGSSAGEPERLPDEGPLEVVLTGGFWMGRHEVTQEEWSAVMKVNPSDYNGTDRARYPVEQVSHGRARAYCRGRTELAAQRGELPPGMMYRLPTEAEWEYACRAGSSTSTAFGNSLSGVQANFDSNQPYGGASITSARDKPVKVGSYPKNDWGLLDMHGNVYEWCLDWYRPYAEGFAADPIGPGRGAKRVLRGGSWAREGELCRSARREKAVPSYREKDLGFRVVLGFPLFRSLVGS